MNSIRRVPLPVLMALPLIAVLAASAQAQQDCGQCNPYSSGCNESCTICMEFSIDQGCLWSIESTCGAYDSPCIPDNCTPNFVETARENRGTYGNGSMFSCSHHAVDWVTRTDANHCNTNSSYQTISTCEDYLDLPGKSGWFPDCCNSYAPGGGYDPRYSCNHQHSC